LISRERKPGPREEAEAEADLSATDALLYRASSEALPLSYLDPLNSDEEKRKVERDPQYNPRYVYAPQQIESLSRLKGELEALEIRPVGLGIFFHQAKDYLCARLTMRLNLGDHPIWQRTIYPMPPERIVAVARRILGAPRRQAQEMVKPFQTDEQVRLLRARLKQYGLDDWKVVVKEGISATNTDPSNRLINVRGGLRYTMDELKRMVVHEVDTHVLRAANGYSQLYRIFAVGAVPSYLMTEEGLAVVNEERMGYIDEPRTRLFAGRLLAAVKAATGSFAEVYREQREYGFDHDTAYLTAKRVKRGLGDTAAPGGYIKEQAYLWGRLMIEEYVVSGGDLSRLYVGKVAFEHLALLPELGLRPPRYIPHPYS
jgi:hypothetical protein